MITLEKFFKALEKVKAEGRWSMGLIIANPKTVDFGLLKNAKEKLVIGGVLPPEAVTEKIANILAAGKWAILEIKKLLPSEVYNQLKSLSLQNRWQTADGAAIRQPDSARVVVVASPETMKDVEADYPDFKFLFGPIINL